MEQSDEIHPVQEVQSSHLLVVEGPNDKAVIEQIVKQYNKAAIGQITEQDKTVLDFEIKSAGGIDEILGSTDGDPLGAIRIDIVEPNLKIYGIVVDADEAINTRWESIKDCIGWGGILLPNTPCRYGVIKDGIVKETNRRLRIGVWLMPDNINPGELEDFVADMIPNGDPVWPKSQSYIDGIPQVHRKFKRKVQRAKVHAWLSARKNPRYMGQAIYDGDLDVNRGLCKRFVAWLTELFG